MEKNLEEIEKILKKKTDEKSEYMSVLNNFGALKEYTKLQELYLNKKQKCNELEKIIEKYDLNTSRKTKIKNELITLESQFQINYQENKKHLDELINIFSENSAKLYKNPGNLIIESNERGFDFNIEIPKITSDGKSKMIIFCYDLMLLETFNNNMDFLIHDSNILDGVDSRQISSSMNLIYEKCQNKENIQYISMINSDILPENLDFDINDYTVLKLSDDNIENSLLGFEF